MDNLKDRYSEKLSTTMLSFFFKILRDNQVDHLESILDNFISLVKRRLGHVEARVRSAKSLSLEEKKKNRRPPEAVRRASR